MFEDNNDSVLLSNNLHLRYTTDFVWNFSAQVSELHINKPSTFQSGKLPSSCYNSLLSNTSQGDHETLPSAVTKDKKERKHLLQKNREAAHRCRQKKKAWLQNLEQKLDISKKKNEELQTIVAQLRNESLYLRNLLLMHNSCGCQVVQEYLCSASAKMSNQTNCNFEVVPRNDCSLFNLYSNNI